MALVCTGPMSTKIRARTVSSMAFRPVVLGALPLKNRRPSRRGSRRAALGRKPSRNHDQARLAAERQCVGQARQKHGGRANSFMRGVPPRPNGNTMMKTPSQRRKAVRAGDLRPEYRFDYSKSRANRFASKFGAQTVAVLLEPDVAGAVGDRARAATSGGME